MTVRDHSQPKKPSPWFCLPSILDRWRRELSNLLQASWKTTGGAVVPARASELREGELIAEKGSYVLSGAGIQWVRADLIPTLRKLVVQ